MNNEKWKDLIIRIDENFGFDEEYTVEDNLEDDTGKSHKGTKDVVIFNGVQGKMKLERINHPMILEKKMHYHKGAGGTAEVEYIVSDTEETNKVKAYIWDETEDDWKELSFSAENMKF